METEESSNMREGEVTWSKMSTMGKIIHLLKNITIEPVIALYILLKNTEGIVSTVFKLEKSCLVNNHYSEMICTDVLSAVNTNETIVNNIQKTVTQMSSWVDPIQNGLMLILLLFLGSWSDRNRRRKPCLLLPLSGELGNMIGLLICTYFFMSLPVEVNGLIQGILPSITGGMMCIEIAIFSYISDITKEDERTFRISFVATMVTFTQPIGSHLSKIIYEHGKYYGTFSICAVCYMVAILYGLFVIREPTTPKPLTGRFCRDFFDFSHVTETVKVLTKKRKGNGRLNVILVVILSLLLTIPIIGEGKIGQLFLMKQLNWDINKYSDYATFFYTVTIVGSFMILALLGSSLQINDCYLGIIACILKLIVNVLYTFSKDPTTFYVLALLEVLSVFSVTVMRSITTKVVPPDDLGKMYALLGLAQAGAAVFIPSVYDLLYTFTVDVLPGAYFLLGAVISFFAIVNFLFIDALQKQDASKTKFEAKDLNASAVDNKGFDDIDLNGDINGQIQTKL